MVVDKKSEGKITVSFSGKVGTAGLNRIKDFIELIESYSGMARKRVPKSTIDKISDEITSAAWERLKKERGLK